MQLNKFELDKDTLIGGWFMPESVIDDINEYWNSPDAQQYKDSGQSGNSGVNLSTKESIDISIRPEDDSNPWSEYRKHLQGCLNNYLKLFPAANNVKTFNIREIYNLQWYPKGGGYKKWHSEITGDSWNIHRHLVFMTYCGDVPDAGTHFKYQNITVPCKKGLTLIWPSAWTHTHKGQISNDHEKMIVTGWYNFNEIYDKLQ
jgi:hypothetical protein